MAIWEPPRPPGGATKMCQFFLTHLCHKVVGSGLVSLGSSAFKMRTGSIVRETALAKCLKPMEKLVLVPDKTSCGALWGLTRRSARVGHQGPFGDGDQMLRPCRDQRGGVTLRSQHGCNDW